MLSPNTRFLRLHQILGRPARDGAPAIPALVPVSKSTWWNGVKSGRFPKPNHSLGPRIALWRCEDIEALTSDSTGDPK